MPLEELKKELAAFIENTNDEELLHLIKEDFIFYGKTKDTNITDDLSKEQFTELKELAEEDETKNTDTLNEFKKSTDRWRDKNVNTRGRNEIVFGSLKGKISIPDDFDEPVDDLRSIYNEGVFV